MHVMSEEDLLVLVKTDIREYSFTLKQRVRFCIQRDTHIEKIMDSTCLTWEIISLLLKLLWLCHTNCTNYITLTSRKVD